MAQQNQEINLADPETYPLRRKRGRPRKYDGPAYEARRRYLSPHSIPNPTNLVGSSQGLSFVPSRVNSNLTLNCSPQVTPIQVNPTQLNPVPISSIRPEAIPVQPTPVSGSHSLQSQANAQCNATSSLQYGIGAFPAQPTPIANSNSSRCMPSANSSHASHTPPASSSHASHMPPASSSHASHMPPASSSHASHMPPASSSHASHMPPASSSHASHMPPASSSHASHTLVGQSVSGVLDGTFDAGYLLTVQVGSTGDVLKGLVFDPRLCIPVSAENDIAPLLPLASSREVLHSVARTPIREPISTPIRSTPTLITVALPIQTREPPAPRSVNHALDSSTSGLSKINPESILLKVSTNESSPGCHEMPKTTRTEIQTAILRTLSRESAGIENQTSLTNATHQTAVNNITYETLLFPVFSKETEKNQPDQSLHSTEASAVNKSQVQNDKPSPCMDEEPKKAESVQQKGDSSKDENKEPDGEEGQNLEALTSGLNDEVSSAEISNKQKELPDIVVGR